MAIIEVFTRRLRIARTSSGMLQTELAEAIRCKREIISAYENGARTPRIDRLLLMCQVLHVSADWLLGLSDVRERRGHT